jgi:clan AA aspartic protease
VRGAVNDRLQLTVTVVLRAHLGLYQNVECMVDTGYSGTIALPLSLIRSLNLQARAAKTQTVLADGTIFRTDTYERRIVWGGIERAVRVIAAGEMPLIGMGLLYGCLLSIEAVGDGEVTVDEMGFEVTT